jgi:hypothetical protein
MLFPLPDGVLPNPSPYHLPKLCPLNFWATFESKLRHNFPKGSLC